ncbi:PadR family transcriptional regulator [Solicola gregarius]|uniref:PadR family transcriptional regulator n=1 Tax=Solicola gregarius TaxID=2908642 RepID=A0AA46TL64_9ACTN|nr:PadR family transcriptional regulator [Solicola gregarius]UYM07344.1 PadR family transcriptional regulator [Solicola gregarius]
MARRGAALELAVLGLLQDSPMHGYELRKRLNALLGWGRVLSYGTLYPCLKGLLKSGHIESEDAPETSRSARRARIVYKLTPAGKEHLTELLAQSGPSSWDDETFGVRFAFFARTDSRTRVRILEGRRSRLEERVENVRASLARSRERVDAYTLELQRHGLEAAEHEVRWLTGLINAERSGAPPRGEDDDPSSGRDSTRHHNTDR